METTLSILKHGGPSTVVLVALLFIWADLNGALNGGLNELRAEMIKGDQAIRAEMNAGFQAIRAEMNAGFQAIRAEMNAGDQAIRAEMGGGFKLVRADISALGERMARVETRLDSIEDRLYTDTSRPTM